MGKQMKNDVISADLHKKVFKNLEIFLKKVEVGINLKNFDKNMNIKSTEIVNEIKKIIKLKLRNEHRSQIKIENSYLKK